MKKYLLFAVSLACLLLFVLPSISAARVMQLPIKPYQNYTTTIYLNCSKAIGDDPVNATNATLYYNASGGKVYAAIAGSTAINTTVNGLMFYDSDGASITGLTDGTTYNITCKFSNLTGEDFYASANESITIDNTAPTITLTATPTVNRPTLNDNVSIVWTNLDRTSREKTSALTITANELMGCSIGTTSFSAINGTEGLTSNTTCPGTYTVSFTATDYAGNTATDSETFTIYSKEGGSGGGVIPTSTQVSNQLTVTSAKSNILSLFTKPITWIIGGVVIVLVIILSSLGGKKRRR